jgi:aryl-alcohol dehydrogenase-like predicted oxidoreductase
VNRGSRPAPRAFIGTLNFSRRSNELESIAVLAAAHELGIRGLSTADSDYSGRSELYVGKFLRLLGADERPYLMVELSGVDMGVPHDPNLTPNYLRAACERSLVRLGVENVDRVVIPRPSLRTPLEETLAGVQELIIEQGLAASYGVSTFPAWLTSHGQHVCRDLGNPPIASELAPYNILDRRVENEMLPNARFWGMEFFAWAALGQGLLAGRYMGNGANLADSRASVLGGIYAQRVGGRARAAGSKFVQLCAAFGYEPAVAALAWLLAQSGVSGFVAGPRTVAQLAPVATALDVKLDPQFMTGVDAINPPGSAVADFFNSAPWMLQRA